MPRRVSAGAASQQKKHIPTAVILKKALAAHEQRQLAVAERLYRVAIRRHPHHPETNHLLGVLCIQTRRPNDAVKLISRALALKPEVADWYSNLAEAYRLTGEPDRAAAACREAIRINPAHAEAYNSLGIALVELGDLDGALEGFYTALGLRPDYVDAWTNLGSALKKANRADEAVAACERALALSPRHAPALNNLGNALAHLGKWAHAIPSFQQAIEIEPNYAAAYGNLCNAMCAVGETEVGVRAGERAVALSPRSYELNHNLAMALLQSGELRRGFDAFECRWWQNCEHPEKRYGMPNWGGSSIAGKTILLHTEQGFGDTIQFCRYVPLVAALGARVILQCQPELAHLMSTLKGIHRIIGTNDALPTYDTHCALMSLPRVFGTDLQTIPSQVPYLHVPAERLDHSETLGEPRPMRVGLAWAGNPLLANDRYRSIPLTQLAPLMQLAGPVQFYAIQKGTATTQAHQPPFDHLLTPLPERATSFYETAQRIAALDLLISVDTAVAHLAGALGKPVWTLIAQPSDWRWLTEIETTPWYPTMRLFRQTTPGDWPHVIARVAPALSHFVSKRTMAV